MQVIKEELVEIRTGRTVHYRVVRSSSGSSKPKYQLLFLHGTCASSAQYNGLLEELEEEEGVVCHLYDSISCGKSPMVRDWESYHTNQSVLDVKSILEDAMDTSLPTMLVAHSYAPTILIRYLHRHGVPSNVKGCVFLSSAMSGEANPIPNGGHGIFKLPIFVLDCLQPTMTKGFLDMAYHPKTDPKLVELASSANSGNNMYMAKAYHTHHEWATREECSNLDDLPVLVLHGKDDKVLPAQAGEYLADVVKAKQFILVEDTSHQLMEEKPKEVARHIVEFMKEL